MKKNYSLLKRYALALILTTSIIIGSCRKEKFTDKDAKTELIDDSKKFFEQNVLASEHIIANDRNFRHNLNKEPNWSKASVSNTAVGEAVIVPIGYKIILKAKSDNQKGEIIPFSYLMIYNDKKGVKHAECVTLMSSSHIRSESSQFIGTIIVEDWYGQFIKAFAYGIEGDILPLSLSESTLFKKINFKDLYCYTIEYWGHNYTEGYPESDYWYIGGTETYCFGTVDIEDNDGPNPGDYGQGGASSGYSDPRATPEMLLFEQDYKSRMSTDELNLYNNMGRSSQLTYLVNAKTATDMALTKFPNISQGNTQADAFRHAYFTLSNVDAFGHDLTKALGDAHENNSIQPAIQRNMDLYNNERGRNAYIPYYPGAQIFNFYSDIAYNLVTSGAFVI